MTPIRLRSIVLAAASSAVILVSACTSEAGAANSGDGGSSDSQGASPLKAPLGLEAVPLPESADNPLTEAKYHLGKQLFFDPRLSKSGNMSCSSCHLPEHAFTDQRKLSPKDDGSMNSRNSPSMYNVGYQKQWYWDGRKPTLEAVVLAAWTGQCKGDATEVSSRLEAVPAYKAAFQKAFEAPASEDTIVKALASFLRGLRSGNSAYDKFAADGTANPLSEEAAKGFNLFVGKAGCVTCHSMPLFTDMIYHNVGIGMDAENPDLGRGKIDDTKKGAFKTPTLREVARTAPYFHDGSVATLREAVKLMASGGIDNPNKDPLLMNRNLSDAEIDQLVAFLESLNGGVPFEKPTLPK